MNLRYDLIACFVLRPNSSGDGYEHLQLLRHQDDFMGNTWQPVSGTIEPGETAVAAALRELREEAGVAPIEFYKLDHVSIFLIAPTDTLWHRADFCAIINRDTQIVLNEEHEAFRWIPASAVETSFMWPGDRAAISEIHREILNESLAKPYLRILLPHGGNV